MTSPEPIGDRAEVGQLWRRRNGREVLRIERVWLWPDWHQPGDATVVRGHPMHGGKPLVCSGDYLAGNYELTEVQT